MSGVRQGHGDQALTLLPPDLLEQVSEDERLGSALPKLCSVCVMKEQKILVVITLTHCLAPISISSLYHSPACPRHDHFLNVMLTISSIFRTINSHAQMSPRQDTVLFDLLLSFLKSLV